MLLSGRARVLVLAILLVGVCCAHKRPNARGDGPALELRLPRSGGDAAGGDALDLQTLRGRPVVLWFFATWCLPCQAELRRVERLAAAYRDRVAFWGVALDHEGDRLVGPFRDALGVTLPVALADDLLISGTSALGRIPEVPHVLVLDAQGRPVARLPSVKDTTLEPTLNALLR